MLTRGAAGVSLAILLATSTAVADDGETRRACVSAFEHGQELRKASRLEAARSEFLVCARDVCPNFVQRDCAQWVDELAVETPSLVLVVHDPRGSDLTAKVALDGGPAELVRGEPLALDPGEHHLRFTADGHVPRDERVIARVGERRRVVSVVLDPVLVAAGSPGRPFRVAGGAFIGLSVASALTFGVLAIHGFVRQRELEAECGPGCALDRVAPLRTEYQIADVALAVAIGAAVVATVLFLAQPHSRPTQAAWVGSW